MTPLCIDLFCGLGGWTEGFLANGYRVVGFDIEVRPYPAQLVIQDVLTIHGSQFKAAACIVASPPCQAYSYRAMPWKRAKALPPPDNSLFEACFRIQREANEANGLNARGECIECDGTGNFYRHDEDGDFLPCDACCGGEATLKDYIPMVVENVRGAQKWVGRAPWNYGSFYLWGDVPALMPMRLGRGAKNTGGSWFGQRDGMRLERNDPRGMRRNEKGEWVNAEATGGWNHPGKAMDGTKIGGDWFSDPKSTCWKHGSRSAARKLASAQIAKIPFPLSDWIARCFKPVESERAA